MKFGLYVIPSTDLVIRCIDGVFDYINSSSYERISPTSPARWQAILSAPYASTGTDDVLSKLKNSGSLLTWSRTIAKMFYAVPDDVELYQYGDFGIEL